MSLSRFKGALVGAVIGDCVGSQFEGQSVVPMHDILRVVKGMNTWHQKQKKGMLKYTDDTAMARSVAKSLIENGHFESNDMAHRFSKEFFNEPNRGYGGNVITVFAAIKDGALKDVFQPAREQFDGSGSYGNGGAMRIAPAPLFSFYDSNSSALKSLVSFITRLTHTHPHAIQGAILQAYAVHLSLQLPSVEALNSDQFCDELISIMKPIETNDDNSSTRSLVSKRTTPKRKLDADPTPYCAKLEKVKEFVHMQELSAETVEEVLGNDVSALGSVPTAVLAFLRGSLKDIKDVDEENPFKKVIMYAISLAGDTDTIATMAGAMAGALHGTEAIPEQWQYCCEGVEDAGSAAENFFLRTYNK